ncbi:MAG: tRNA (N6-isopentenyl adenosine(37)-C2)-methylthiotransferase MiaB [Planctomycetes bacterium]|nr:tRNA (N6-isopentenyl adenosine(37)-C2)-methylthiotransferase MiaB [Planctomycetota bacterium]
MSHILLETYGCQMNEYDSELVRSLLSPHSFVDEIHQADVVLLNTCSVRESACNKVHSKLGDLKRLKRERPLRVGVLGCMAQDLQDKLLEEGADFVVGPDRYRELPALIATLVSAPLTLTGTNAGEDYRDISPQRIPGVGAWIAVMRGCDNFCSFCIVPYTRGRERSRTPKSILGEADSAVREGFPQITLLGQNVNSYASEGTDFCSLMEKVSDIPGLRRLRFTSPHPKDFPLRLLRLLASRENLCKQIHLPLQAGNDEVLKRMNRGYTKQAFLDLASRIRDTIPGVTLSTDIIVGFPGESAKQFEDTAEVMQRVGFESSFIFKYSPREHTLAKKKFPDDVSPEEKKRRIVVLNELQDSLTARHFKSLLGSEQEVLIEKRGTKHSPDQVQGRSDGGTVVILNERMDLPVGRFIKVRISGLASHVLMGETI